MGQKTPSRRNVLRTGAASALALPFVQTSSATGGNNIPDSNALEKDDYDEDSHWNSDIKHRRTGTVRVYDWVCDDQHANPRLPIELLGTSAVYEGDEEDGDWVDGSMNNSELVYEYPEQHSIGVISHNHEDYVGGWDNERSQDRNDYNYAEGAIKAALALTPGGWKVTASKIASTMLLSMASDPGNDDDGDANRFFDWGGEAQTNEYWQIWHDFEEGKLMDLEFRSEGTSSHSLGGLWPDVNLEVTVESPYMYVMDCDDSSYEFTSIDGFLEEDCKGVFLTNEGRRAIAAEGKDVKKHPEYFAIPNGSEERFDDDQRVVFVKPTPMV